MSQLEEAYLIMRDIQENGLTNFIQDSMTDYMAKYHPKDELFEKWRDYKQWRTSEDAPLCDDKVTFNKAKELGLFTHALDEAIETIDRTFEFHNEDERSMLSKCKKFLSHISTKYTKDKEYAWQITGK